MKAVNGKRVENLSFFANLLWKKNGGKKGMKDKKGREKRRNKSEKYGRMVQIIPWEYICPSVLPRNTVQKYEI
jgi:hypothetical protein